MENKLSIDLIVELINKNKLDYVTEIAVNNLDYDKLNLIIALATGIAPKTNNILDLMEYVSANYKSRGLQNIY